MKTDDLNIADNFLGMLKNLSSDVRLELISEISDLMKGTKLEEKDNSRKNLYGSFESEQSAEEIIESIRSSRNTIRASK